VCGRIRAAPTSESESKRVRLDFSEVPLSVQRSDGSWAEARQAKGRPCNTCPRKANFLREMVPQMNKVHVRETIGCSSLLRGQMRR
jgi:hypothetical protein